MTTTIETGRAAPPATSPRDHSRRNRRGNACQYGNVWRCAVSGSASLTSERIRTGRRVASKAGSDGTRPESAHPCQKPVTFYDRIIRASSRPGDLVLEPFGGTLRAAVACETMPADEARRYVCIEPDEDGRGYVPAALADLHRRTAAPTLWGGFG